jgi:thiamine biosynthesis lipoprotein
MAMRAVAPAGDTTAPVRIPTRDPGHRRAEHVMGTVVSLVAPGGGADSQAADRCFEWLHEVDRRFSPFRPDSEVSRLMRDAGAAPVSQDLAEVLELCDIVTILSDGAFDIRRHRADGAPDPTGVVKGWATDRAADILAEAGIERFCLNAGGDVVARGGRAAGEPWRIGITDPRRRGAVALSLVADELSVATSGDTERGRHIVDGRTGRPPSGLLAVTVAGPSLARADAYATAAFAMGLSGLRWCESLPGYAACGVDRDGRILVTAGLETWLSSA